MYYIKIAVLLLALAWALLPGLDRAFKAIRKRLGARRKQYQAPHPCRRPHLRRRAGG